MTDRLQTDLQTRLRSVLAGVPTDLLPLIVDYGIERPYSFRTTPKSDFHSFPQFRSETEACSRSDDWYRIPADQSVVDGSNRWRITTKFTGTGWIAFGITAASADCVLVSTDDDYDGDTWKFASTANDLMVRTTASPAFRLDGRLWMLKLSNGGYESTDIDAAMDTESTAFVQVDWPNRCLIVRQIVDGRIVQLRQDLPAGIADINWRPAFVFAGSVTVRIAAADDDT